MQNSHIIWKIETDKMKRVFRKNKGELLQRDLEYCTNVMFRLQEK